MRILFVAMASSIHTARWINQLTGRGWDLHLFSSSGREAHPALREVTVHSLLRKPPFLPRAELRFPRGLLVRHHPSVRQRGLWFPLSIGGGVEHHLERLVPHRAQLLARAIARLRPDIVHSLELNQAGRLALEARERLGGRFPPWIATNWGSDIYLLGRLPEQEAVLRRILAACDYYDCECQRDVELGRQLGFTKEVLPVLPNAGGYDLAACRALRGGPPSTRDVIALKGYQGWAGRALVALAALRRCADLLRGRTLALYSAEDDVVLAARLLCLETGMRLEVLEQRSSHPQVLGAHGRARVSIGLSIGDAISTSALEAMVMGSFPVQSDTSAAGEWFTHGESGLLVPPEDPEAVARALRRALTDDALVDRAAVLNADVVASRLDERLIRPQVVACYERIAARARGTR